MIEDLNTRLIHVWKDNWLENIKNKIIHYINKVEEKIYPRESIPEERIGCNIWN